MKEFEFPYILSLSSRPVREPASPTPSHSAPSQSSHASSFSLYWFSLSSSSDLEPSLPLLFRGKISFSLFSNLSLSWHFDFLIFYFLFLIHGFRCLFKSLQWQFLFQRPLFPQSSLNSNICELQAASDRRLVEGYLRRAAQRNDIFSYSCLVSAGIYNLSLFVIFVYMKLIHICSCLLIVLVPYLFLMALVC